MHPDLTASILTTMKLRSPALSILVVGALAVILIFLAYLQIHWSNQVAKAERERLQTSLHTAVTRFRRDFNREIFRVCWTFDVEQNDPTPQTMQVYADRYQDWVEDSLRPVLVAEVFVWRADALPGHRLLHLSPKKRRFLPAAWTSELLGVRSRLHQEMSASDSFSRAAVHSGMWILDESAPVLFRSLYETRATGGSAGAPTARFRGAVIVELNEEYIERVLFPALAQRSFGGPEGFIYRVSIVRGENPTHVLYQSSAGSSAPLEGGDAVQDLIPGHTVEPPWATLGDLNQARDVQARRRFPPRLVAASGVPGWRLIARHRSGSVETAVLHLRRRTLTVSLSVLLLLALSMALIIISAQRAHRLARLQMSLVANVSHDLRTPLAVIRSAAENLADGVVEGSQKVKEYGALICQEDRKLSEMIQQVLAFAAETSRYRTYEARPVEVASAVEGALAASHPLIQSAGATVEKHLDTGLPPVRADVDAFGRCLQNLISNAVKYGGKTPWIGIRAQLARAPGGSEVQIHVEDHGIGIDSRDLPYIFEPFYRGRSQHTQQVHGTGLGLSLTREIAEAMNGRLTVKSAPGRGSCFTLHLPALMNAGDKCHAAAPGGEDEITVVPASQVTGQD
ncbi:MAG: sensor histidine kinase [Terriglobia bacterium]